MKSDLAVVGAQIAADVRRQIADATAPLLARIVMLEARKPEKGDPGRDGRDGKDGRDGANGKDGANGLSADDVELVQDGHRGVIVKARATGRILGTLRFPIPTYAGVFRKAPRTIRATWSRTAARSGTATTRRT
jgi:hypothetical protein